MQPTTRQTAIQKQIDRIAPLIQNFSSEETRKQARVLLLVSVLVVLLAVNVLQTGAKLTVVNIEVQFVTRTYLMLASALVVIYLWLIYYFSIRIERFDFEVFKNSKIYFENLQSADRLTENQKMREEKARLLQYKRNLRFEETLKISKHIQGLREKNSMEDISVSYRGDAAIEAEEKALRSACEVRYPEAEILTLQQEVDDLYAEFTELYNVYSFSVEVQKKTSTIYRRRKFIEITFISLVALIAIVAATFYVIKHPNFKLDSPQAETKVAKLIAGGCLGFFSDSQEGRIIMVAPDMRRYTISCYK